MSEGGEATAEAAENKWSQHEIRLAEAHRGFVREMDRSLGNAYGRGGGMVLLVFMSCVAVAFFQGWLGDMTMWLGTVTMTLFSLYVVRKRIYARRDGLRKRVEKYCEANELPPRLLRDYYDGEEMYPFFLAIFEGRRKTGGGNLVKEESPKKVDAQ